MFLIISNCSLTLHLLVLSSQTLSTFCVFFGLASSGDGIFGVVENELVRI